MFRNGTGGQGLPGVHVGEGAWGRVLVKKLKWTSEAAAGLSTARRCMMDRVPLKTRPTEPTWNTCGRKRGGGGDNESGDIASWHFHTMNVW